MVSREAWLLVVLIGCDNAAPPAVPGGSLDGAAMKPAVAAPPPPVVLAPPIDPQSTFDGARDFAIELLEKHAYEELVVKLARPVDVEAMRALEGGLERVVAEWAKTEKPAELLDLLLRTRALQPRIDDDGNTVHFDIDDPHVNRHELNFERIAGRWYVHD